MSEPDRPDAFDQLLERIARCGVCGGEDVLAPEAITEVFYDKVLLRMGAHPPLDHHLAIPWESLPPDARLYWRITLHEAVQLADMVPKGRALVKYVGPDIRFSDRECLFGISVMARGIQNPDGTWSVEGVEPEQHQ